MKEGAQGNPGVTGILPIALNEATKALQVLLGGGKEYVCVMQLHESVSEELLRKVLEELQGEVYQRPPLRSSVKRALRKRLIYYNQLLEVKDRYVLFKIGCEAGTYIRKICYDIGQILGSGAHMKELRRTRVGPFTEDRGVANLEVLADACDALKDGDEEPLKSLIHPIEEAFELQPKIIVRDSAVDALCHGADLAVPGVISLDSSMKPGDLVGIFTLKGEVVALGRALMSTEEVLEAEKGLVAKTERVVMKRGTYPRIWKT